MADDSRVPTPPKAVAATPTAAAADPGRPASRRWLRRVLLLLGPLLLVAIGGYVYLTGGRYVGTDNAYVQAPMVTVSADIDGRVVEVMVAENQHVAAGEPLFRLDPEPLRIELAAAEAALDAARNEIAADKAAYREAVEQLELSRANLAFTEREFRRREKLVTERVISESEFDQARTDYRMAQSEVAALEQEQQRLLAALGGDPEIATTEHPRFRAAQARVAQAELDLRHAVVVAPVDGIVSRIDNLRPGDYLRAGAPAFSLVGVSDLWVEANLKETDLTHVRPGQTATVEIDTYPGRVWTARVDSIGAATGSEFSLLPPQNATGNWVKVVQRVPVRLVLTGAPSDAADAPQLRAGMSAVVEIDTGHRRSLPSLVGRALAWVNGG